MENRIKVLIVDDEFRSLHTLSKRLSFHDYDVTPVMSGRQAIETARDDEFDLAIVDLKMPGMSGEKVLEKLKTEHPSIEIVILADYGSIDSVVKCARSRSFFYLQKPYHIDELMTVLEERYQKRIQRKNALGDNKLKDWLDSSIRKISLSD